MTQKITVLMMPDYRAGNPFQHLLEQSLSKQGVEVIFAIGYKRIFPVYRQVRRNTAIDILHLHWITPYLKGENSFVVAIYALKFIGDIILTKLSGINIIWTIHNQVSHDTRFPRIEIFTYRMISKLVNGAILHGNSLKEVIKKDYKITDEKLSIINLGNYKDVYPPPIEKQEARKKLAIAKEARKVFLHQGLLKPYKGIEELIQVWNQHVGEFHDQVLIIAGKAPDKAYENTLKALISNNRTIHFISRYVTDEEISGLYSACDVVILPFRRIMASSSLMLAISFGKPVIAPKLGATEELLGDASDLLYEPNDGSDGLFESMRKSGQIDLQVLSGRTGARADFYNWNDIGKMTADLYRKFIKSES
jgi:beta-1,4-mannosyltransferase